MPSMRAGHRGIREAPAKPIAMLHRRTTENIAFQTRVTRRIKPRLT
jgi:hypothetical protein